MGFLLALLAAMMWGLTPVAIKGALTGYSPEMISVVRLAVAAVVFRWLGGPGTGWLPRERWTLIAGVALGADFLIYNYGVGMTTAGLASLVVNVEVVSTILLALWLLGEPLTAVRVTGAVVTLAGVLYIASEGVDTAGLLDRSHRTGNLLVMLAGVSWSLYAVAQRRAPRAGNMFEVMAPIFSVAALTTLPGMLRPGAWEMGGGLFATGMFGTLILLSTIGVYVVYARTQELLDMSVLAIVLTSIPVFTIAMSRVILGETISARAGAGAAVVIAGVLVLALERPAVAAATPPKTS